MQLTRSQSMTRAYEFAGVRQRGVSSAGRFLVVSILEDPSLDTSQFGIICTKKVGKAHLRNKLRRRIREILREHGDCFGKNHFVVTVLRWRAAEAEYDELAQDWLRAARRIKRGEGRKQSDIKRPGKPGHPAGNQSGKKSGVEAVGRKEEDSVETSGILSDKVQ